LCIVTSNHLSRCSGVNVGHNAPIVRDAGLMHFYPRIFPPRVGDLPVSWDLFARGPATGSAGPPAKMPQRLVRYRPKALAGSAGRPCLARWAFRGHRVPQLTQMEGALFLRDCCSACTLALGTGIQPVSQRIIFSFQVQNDANTCQIHSAICQHRNLFQPCQIFLAVSSGTASGTPRGDQATQLIEPDCLHAYPHAPSCHGD